MEDFAAGDDQCRQVISPNVYGDVACILFAGTFVLMGVEERCET